MTQRNPMNDRYTNDDGRKGKTRKSAASAKPATKAAASVYIESAKKPPKKKGFLASLAGGGSTADQKKDQQKKAEANKITNADYFNPPTPEYKRLRRIWWVLLICAVVFTALSFALNSFGVQGPVAIATLVIAYACILSALYLDFVKIRKERRRYQESVEHAKTKAAKRERKAREAELAAEREEAEKKAAEAAAKRAEKKSAVKSFFSGKKKADEAASEQAEPKE